MSKKKKSRRRSIPRCGLCGKKARLTRTECCGQWICDDIEKYETFSYSRDSCWRNHSSYTLCALHFNEEHEGDWQDCSECRETFDTEMYVWNGTNEYNFEKLRNIPKFDPTYCAGCDRVIVKGRDGFSSMKGKFYCMKCTERDNPGMF